MRPSLRPTLPDAARRLAGRLLLGGLCCVPVAQAATIDYRLLPLGPDLWRYEYTLQVTAASPAFDEFTVYFEASDTQEILAFQVPTGWDAFLAQVDPGLPDAGFVDALHLAGALVQGSVSPGFSVDFRSSPGALPGQQRFDLIVSQPFTVVASGITSAVPEPAAWALLLAGLGLCGSVAARRQAGQPEARP